MSTGTEKKEEKAAYFAILPANVRYDNNLKATEKIMYAEITALSNAKGYCYATNSYFSKLYNTTKNTISRWINSLKEKGYLAIKFVYENDTIKERRIYIADNKKVSPDGGVSSEMMRGYHQKKGGGIIRNDEDNNTSINNININNKTYSTLDNVQRKKVDKKEIPKQQNPEAEKIWQLYPLKRGKANAIKKIPKLIKQYGVEQIQRCIARYVEDVDLRRKTDFKDLKYQNGSTFFNAGYMDYLDTEYKEDKKVKNENKKKFEGNTDIVMDFWKK